MNLSFSGTWNSECNENVVLWSKEKLISLNGEEPENELLDYIALMVGNKKSMFQINEELTQILEDKEKLRAFVEGLGDVVTILNAEQTKSNSLAAKSAISVSKSQSGSNSKDDILNKPLAAGRRGDNKFEKREHGSSRLLANAISDSSASQLLNPRQQKKRPAEESEVKSLNLTSSSSKKIIFPHQVQAQHNQNFNQNQNNIDLKRPRNYDTRPNEGVNISSRLSHNHSLPNQQQFTIPALPPQQIAVIPQLNQAEMMATMMSMMMGMQNPANFMMNNMASTFPQGPQAYAGASVPPQFHQRPIYNPAPNVPAPVVVPASSANPSVSTGAPVEVFIHPVGRSAIERLSSTIKRAFPLRSNLQLFELNEVVSFVCSVKATEVSGKKVGVDLLTGQLLSNGAYGVMLEEREQSQQQQAHQQVASTWYRGGGGRGGGRVPGGYHGGRAAPFTGRGFLGRGAGGRLGNKSWVRENNEQVPTTDSSGGNNLAIPGPASTTTD